MEQGWRGGTGRSKHSKANSKDLPVCDTRDSIQGETDEVGNKVLVPVPQNQLFNTQNKPLSTCPSPTAEICPHHSDALKR